MNLIFIVNLETGDRVQTTQKVLENYYSHQGYVVESEFDDGGKAPFLEVSPPIDSNRQPALRGAAKAAAERKAKQQG